MNEESMVRDALNFINSGLKTYQDMISQTDNQELRMVLQQMRNETETSQYELYNMAKTKNYYHPAQPATTEAISKVKSCCASNSTKMN